MVVTTTKRPTLIGHGPAPIILVTSSTRSVPCSHLGSQDTGWWAGVGVGVARVIHGVGVMVHIRTMAPDGGSREEEEDGLEDEVQKNENLL